MESAKYIALFSGPGNSNYPGCNSSAWVKMKAQSLDEMERELMLLIQEKHVAAGASLDKVWVVVSPSCVVGYPVDVMWKQILQDQKRSEKIGRVRDLAEQLVQIQEEIDKLQQEMREES